MELTTTVLPKKDRDSGAVGANVNCKIKGYSILSSLIQAPGTDTGSQQASFVEVEVTQNKPVSVKAGGTKTVNVEHQVSVRDHRRRVGFLTWTLIKRRLRLSTGY